MSDSVPQVPLSSRRTAAGLLFVSGQLGFDVQGGPLPTFEEQMRAAMESLGTQLSAEELDFSDVVRTTVFLTDAADFPAMNSIYSDYFTSPFPTRSSVIVELALPGFSFEIDAIAAFRD